MSPYTVYITPIAWDEVQDLPGHMRQRVRRAIAALADEPRPAESKALERPIQEEARDAQASAASADDPSQEPAHELRRIRIERWRIVYAITETDQAIDVLTVRKRPPYDYGDLERLLSEI
ncbi:MAG TPA: type II toxin-antitoxin system RelE/ParE family toxin [Roseiflexaceae bacterium]|nr:type II toxin-antitoxin system RelE/ParE family toxin [Roseiflexaceae bacterium]